MREGEEGIVGRERTGEGEAKEGWKTCLHRFSLN